MDIQPEDKRFYVLNPDKDFSPEHNKRVIENTIKKNEARLKKLRQKRQDGIGERAHMIASYFKSRAVESRKPIEKYLGKEWMNRLRGEEILDEIIMRSRPTTTIGDVARMATKNPTVKARRLGDDA